MTTNASSSTTKIKSNNVTLGDYFKNATKNLHAAGVESARLDVLILLEDELGQDRSLLLAHAEREIPAKNLKKLNTKIAQRAKHVPLAYIRGKAEFYGREFYVDKRVLVPRPETEVMIELLKRTQFALQHALPLHFVDVGCGSGCIGITAALEIPGAELELRDISYEAMSAALQNAERHGVAAKTSTGDLFEYPPLTFTDAVFANLPYVPDGHPINRAATYEPSLALFAGSDGLDLYRRFWQQLGKTKPDQLPTYIFTESLASQHDTLKIMAKEAGYAQVAASGLIQQFKLERSSPSVHSAS